MKNFIRQWLGINDDADLRCEQNFHLIDDANLRMGHLSKRVDDNEALLKRIYDHLRAIWKI